MGTLYYGDNVDILRRYLKEETVDLVYLVASENRSNQIRLNPTDRNKNKENER